MFQVKSLAKLANLNCSAVLITVHPLSWLTLEPSSYWGTPTITSTGPSSISPNILKRLM